MTAPRYTVPGVWCEFHWRAEWPDMLSTAPGYVLCPSCGRCLRPRRPIWTVGDPEHPPVVRDCTIPRHKRNARKEEQR